MDKDCLREKIRGEKRKFSFEELKDLSRPIIEKLLLHPKTVKAKRILMYFPLKDEVDTLGAILSLKQKGKEVFLPRIIERGRMELAKFEGLDFLKEGPFGIMEPTAKALEDLETIELAIIPGMAFDTKGNRLGRGKGYYDLLLKNMKKTYKIGLCFNFQKIPLIPHFLHDEKVDEVL